MPTITVSAVVYLYGPWVYTWGRAAPALAGTRDTQQFMHKLRQLVFDEKQGCRRVAGMCQEGSDTEWL